MVVLTASSSDNGQPTVSSDYTVFETVYSVYSQCSFHSEPTIVVDDFCVHTVCVFSIDVINRKVCCNFNLFNLYSTYLFFNLFKILFNSADTYYYTDYDMVSCRV